MENIIHTITGNTYFMIAAVVIILLLVFSMVKKLFKLAIVLIVVFVGYVLYLNFTGQDVERTLKKNMKTIEKTAGDVKDKVGDVMDNEAVKKTIDKAADSFKSK